MIEMLIRYCACAGFVIVLFFLALHYRLLSPDHPRLRGWCRMSSSSCSSILTLPEAHVFGIPNFFFGLFYYPAVFFLPLHPFEAYFLISTIFAAGLGLYLSYVLIRKLKVYCIPCFAIHALNLTLVVLFLIHASLWHGL
jgi:uncharacterized membrane protein